MGQMVPLFIDINPFQTKIRAQIDHLRVFQDFVPYDRCAEALGCCRENDVSLLRKLIQIISQAVRVDNLKHVSVYICIFLTGVTSGSVPDNLCFRMLKKKPDKLCAGISG